MIFDSRTNNRIPATYHRIVVSYPRRAWGNLLIYSDCRLSNPMRVRGALHDDNAELHHGNCFGIMSVRSVVYLENLLLIKGWPKASVIMNCSINCQDMVLREDCRVNRVPMKGIINNDNLIFNDRGTIGRMPVQSIIWPEKMGLDQRSASSSLAMKS